MQIDLTLSPMHRVGGRALASLPGLIATAASRGVARGREGTAFLVHLILTGSAVLSSAEYAQLSRAAVEPFFKAAGTATGALRRAAEAINLRLLERNATTRAQGQYAAGWLVLAALRESTCTLLVSGAMHVLHLGSAAVRHIHEPSLAGRGLGFAQTITFHFAQETVVAGDQLLFCGRLPSSWEGLLGQAGAAPAQALRRRLLATTAEDLNAVLIETSQGTGRLTVMTGEEAAHTPAGATPAPQATAASEDVVAAPAGSSPEDSATLAEEPAPAWPSAYAIPPEQPALSPATPRADSPAWEAQPSRPQVGLPERATQREHRAASKAAQSSAPSQPPEGVRRTARFLSGAIQRWRRATERIGDGFQRFLPRLLPGPASGSTRGFPAPIMTVVALLVPVAVVLIASTVYFRYGRSLQYETYLTEAREARVLALSMANPLEQRVAWEAVLLNISKAESSRRTSETESLRTEAETALDGLFGILRLQYSPAFSSDLGIQISRMAATDGDLFLLDAEQGGVQHAQVTAARRFEIDASFNCSPGVYGGYTVGPLVDILALPSVSTLQSTLLGIDAAGHLLYCTPGRVAQAIPLPPPDTNWGRVTAITMDAGNLYVLDAPARAVWVYAGKDGTFIDRPYFFFGGQTPEKQDVIDLAVSNDDLYLLHADGHLSTCSYSRIGTVPTRCEDPAPYNNPFAAAYSDDGSALDLFASAHFTQLVFAAPPDQSLLLLDADSQGVFRLTARGLELQNQLRPTTGDSNPVPQGPIGAMTVSPNHVLFLAIKGQVYFSSGLP